MAHVEAFATKLPSDLKKALDQVCEKLGLRKNYVVETALREKIEDLLDMQDLDSAIKESTGFRPWVSIRTEFQGKRKKALSR